MLPVFTHTTFASGSNNFSGETSLRSCKCRRATFKISKNIYARSLRPREPREESLICAIPDFIRIPRKSRTAFLVTAVSGTSWYVLDNPDFHFESVSRQCGGNIADSKAGDKLAFCEDGTSLHLVMSLSNEGREGIGFRRAGVGFMLKDVPEKKKPSEKNPYASVSHVLCSNKRAGKMCNKKVQ